MSRRAVFLAMVVLAVQIGMLREVRIAGAHPDLLLLFAVVAGITGGTERGAVAGFALGLLADVFAPTPLGTFALADLLAGAAAGSLAVGMDTVAWVTSILAFGTSALGVIIAAVLARLTHGGELTSHVATVALVSAGINAVLSPLVAWLLRPAWFGAEPA